MLVTQPTIYWASEENKMFHKSEPHDVFKIRGKFHICVYSCEMDGKCKNWRNDTSFAAAWTGVHTVAHVSRKAPKANYIVELFPRGERALDSKKYDFIDDIRSFADLLIFPNNLRTNVTVAGSVEVLLYFMPKNTKWPGMHLSVLE